MNEDKMINALIEYCNDSPNCRFCRFENTHPCPVFKIVEDFGYEEELEKILR